MRILEKHLTFMVAAKEMGEEAPSRVFVVVTLDMLDGLCSGLGPSFEAFLAADRSKLMPMVLYCLKVGRGFLLAGHFSCALQFSF